MIKPKNNVIKIIKTTKNVDNSFNQFYLIIAILVLNLVIINIGFFMYITELNDKILQLENTLSEITSTTNTHQNTNINKYIVGSIFLSLTCVLFIYLFSNSDPSFNILSEQIFSHSKNLTQLSEKFTTQLLSNNEVISSQIKALTTLISEKFQNLNSYLLRINSASNFDFSNIKPN